MFDVRVCVCVTCVDVYTHSHALPRVHRNKSAKKQALEAIKLLESKFPIERLPMNLKITFPLTARAEVRDKVLALGATFDREDDRFVGFLLLAYGSSFVQKKARGSAWACRL